MPAVTILPRLEVGAVRCIIAQHVAHSIWHSRTDRGDQQPVTDRSCGQAFGALVDFCRGMDQQVMASGTNALEPQSEPQLESDVRLPLGLRICLAASGGGHVRQILDLEPFWGCRDSYIATEPTALGRSLAEKYRVHFVEHFALGQARLGSKLTLLRSGLLNFVQSWRHLRAERPDLIISTGAGSALFTAVLGKAFGAKLILIESFARVHNPSLFGRLARRFADHLVVQSPALRKFWPEAVVCDPLKVLDNNRPTKEPLALVTVGTVLPFDRLVEGVAALRRAGLLPEKTIAQVGDGGVFCAELESQERLSFSQIQEIIKRADIVFCHGGTGSLITALRQGCRVIAMPRLAEKGEHYDDHQSEIVTSFAERGLIQVATEAGDLADALERARQVEPVRATTDPQRLLDLLQAIAEGGERAVQE